MTSREQHVTQAVCMLLGACRLPEPEQGARRCVVCRLCKAQPLLPNGTEHCPVGLGSGNIMSVKTKLLIVVQTMLS